ncbi:ydhJ domain protein (plasmid) [Ochrobactrum quorumnocens]|uniref:YdhJ domain protein n=1 Tax=Ochrobactrum quorumnocens TaxID=271865 RepID=A0A248UP08_9HYPH|nr:ydhJ domain protein [[Ochrobactrum] quorumnocens]
MASAAYKAAPATLARTTIRSPVDGYVTNLRLRTGDYATSGATKVAIIDTASGAPTILRS